MSKINIYVNSKNRKSDETPSNFSVIIPDGLIKVNNDEYFTLSVNSFYCYNDFYQCNNNCNKFLLITKNSSGITTSSITLDITVGNPNAMDILNYINAVLKNTNVLSCDYFSVTNKFIFTRLMQETPEAYELYINPLKAGCFLGFKDNTEVLISFNTTTSTFPININSITALTIGIDGDISFNHNNLESNLNNSV